MEKRKKDLDEKWMRAAIEVASKGAGRTHPNPAVGAVVVKDGEAIGKGYHKKPGGPHAEIVALNDAGDLAKGADLYVTLEPCPTYGKTPPCTDAIVRSGVRRVIAGTGDPNPDVNGRGFSALKKHGIEVVENYLEAESISADIAYHTYFKKNRPYINLKWAQSLDGATAKPGGGYITGMSARQKVHEERFLSDAIMVTSGTIKRDNPQLTIRLARKKKPLLRVVVDRHGLKKLPARFIGTAPGSGEIWVLRPGTVKAPNIKYDGVKTFILDCGEDLDSFLPVILKFLREKQILSLYVESVGSLATSLIKNNWADRLSIDVAQVILGKGSAPAPVCQPLKKPLNIKGCREELMGNDRIYHIDLDGKCLRD